MKSGVIIGHKNYVVPGVEVRSFRDETVRTPEAIHRGRRKCPVQGVVVHVHRSFVGQLRPGSGPQRPAELLALYQVRGTDRGVGWDVTSGTDGRMIWQNDPAFHATWHAGKHNDRMIGMMCAEDEEGAQFEEQIRAQVALLNVLSRVLRFPRQVPIVLVDGRVEPDVSFIPCLADSPEQVYGVFAYANLTTERPRYLASVALSKALLRAGWMGFNFRAHEDVRFWQSVQHRLGLVVNGKPGEETFAALEDAGFRHGQIVKVPEDTIRGDAADAIARLAGYFTENGRAEAGSASREGAR